MANSRIFAIDAAAGVTIFVWEAEQMQFNFTVMAFLRRADKNGLIGLANKK